MIAPESCPYPSHPPPVKVRLVILPSHPCNYLPDRIAQDRAFYADQIPPELYHEFMDAGFRRSGKVIYQPVCRGCRACLTIRVPVEKFWANKSQRRCWRRNADLVVSVDTPVVTEEKFELYSRYLKEWHGRESAEDEGRESFQSFLYDSPVDTIEFCYRAPDGKLLAVGICDRCHRSLSSVYFYFDPAESSRGLGTFGAMYELDWARRSQVPFYYLGYWVRGCAAMEYKAYFHPSEVLQSDGKWVAHSTAMQQLDK